MPSLAHPFSIWRRVDRGRPPCCLTLSSHAFSRAVLVHDELQSLAREVQSLSGQLAGVVSLYANASAIVGFLPERLNAFQAQYPLV